MPSNCNQEQWRGSASTLIDCLCPFFSWSKVISWPTIPPPCHCLHPCSPSPIHSKWWLLSATVSFVFGTMLLWKAQRETFRTSSPVTFWLWVSTLFSLNLEPLSGFLSATRRLLLTARQKHWWQDINFLKSVGLNETCRICPFCESHKPSVRP